MTAPGRGSVGLPDAAMALGPRAELRLLGGNLRTTPRLMAELTIRAPAEQRDDRWQVCIAGVESQVYAEVEGLGRAAGQLVEPIGARADGSLGCLLSFTLSPEMIDAIRAGACFGFGIDDDRMRVGAEVKRATRQSLVA